LDRNDLKPGVLVWVGLVLADRIHLVDLRYGVLVVLGSVACRSEVASTSARALVVYVLTGCPAP